MKKKMLVVRFVFTENDGTKHAVGGLRTVGYFTTRRGLSRVWNNLWREGAKKFWQSHDRDGGMLEIQRVMQDPLDKLP